MTPEERFLEDVRLELGHAREKFPGNKHQATAMAEEAGEVMKALLENTYETGDPEPVYWECVQTAAMALRVAIEGDHSFPYELAQVRDHMLPREDRRDLPLEER